MGFEEHADKLGILFLRLDKERIVMESSNKKGWSVLPGFSMYGILRKTGIQLKD